VRTLLGAGTALVLQVAHPTVAAGVREHSDFERDPWGRLLRTLDYVNLLVYGGPEPAMRAGRRMRAMHQRIRGVAPDGTRYHALEPAAYAWVHATLAETIVGANAQFGVPLTLAEREDFWRQWRGLGFLLGIRERDLPPTWAGFRAYVDETVATQLHDNDVVRTVLRSLASPAAPPLPFPVPGALWRAGSRPLAAASGLATVGLLSPPAREVLDLPWSPRRERDLHALGTVLRRATPVLPAAARTMGPRYLRWRAAEIDRGMLGGPDG
jgi:uncharacterized protein (DUF2236 family)